MGEVIEGAGEEAAATAQEELEASAPNIPQSLIDAITAAAGQLGIGVNEAGEVTAEGVDFESLDPGTTPSLTPAIQQSLDFGTGRARDPRFEALRAAQTASLERGQQQQRASQSEFLRRRNVGGSAALNENRRLERDLSLEGQNLAANLGLQEFQAQRQAVQSASGLATAEQGRQLGGIQSRNFATQSRLQSIAAGIETLSLPTQLEIARLAAMNAGTVEESGGGGKK